VNIIGNCFLISRLGALGAAISSVLGEIVITLLEFVYISRNSPISILTIIKMSLKYLISGIVMLVLINIVKAYVDTDAVGLTILIAVGGITYFICLLMLRETFVVFAINKIKGRLKRVQ
jgi:peptidoglycan biosynthesis protein MviN/MurJ (putative lipid II flippase)